jgi:hypothetical protein
MSPVVDTFAIAARIRSLVAAPNFGGLEATARRLQVPEFALRLSLDDTAPHPTLDVLAAIVREFGVDPHWLIHGEYNSATHHAVLDDDQRVTPTVLLALASPPDRTTATQTHELRIELPVHVESIPQASGAPFALAARPTQAGKEDQTHGLSDVTRSSDHSDEGRDVFRDL